MNKHKHKVNIKLSILAIVIIGGALMILVLELTNTTHLFHKTAVVRAPSTPITKLPVKATSNNSNNGVKVPTSTSTLNQGSPTDKNGQVPSSGVPTDPSKWSSSASGVITVKLPTSNSTLQSGDTLTGTASVNLVQYRLIDSQVGVISQGPINVVNGNFTAAINFKSNGSSGRLDVFTADSSGRESNEVQIPINF